MSPRHIFRGQGEQRAFTLIEMMLVVSVLAMMGLAIYQSIANGINVWENTRRFSLEADMLIFMDKLGMDLRQTFSFSKFSFEGDSADLKFPALVRTLQDPAIDASGERYVDQVGMVEYEFDAAGQKIARRQANYSLALKKKYGPRRVLVNRVESLTLSYLVPENKSYVWQDRVEGVIPAAVLVEVRFRESSGALRTLTRMISIPLGG